MPTYIFNHNNMLGGKINRLTKMANTFTMNFIGNTHKHSQKKFFGIFTKSINFLR